MVTQTLISEEQRLGFLPQHLGNHHLKFEQYAFGFMNRFSETYDGGYWDFFKLSNSSLFIAPSTDEKFRMVNPMNYSDEILSAQGAGIGITLYALNALTCETQALKLVDLYYGLRDYAAEHHESAAIFRFID